MRCFIHIRFIDHESAKLWFDNSTDMDVAATALRAAKQTDVVPIKRERGGEMTVCMWAVTHWEVGYA